MFLSPGARARRSSSAVSVVVDEQRATGNITAATHHHHPPPQPVCCLFLSLSLSLFFFSDEEKVLRHRHRGNKDDVRFPDFHPLFSCVVFFLKKRRDFLLKSLSGQFSNSSLSRQTTGLSSFPQNSLFSLSRV